MSLRNSVSDNRPELLLSLIALIAWTLAVAWGPAERNQPDRIRPGGTMTSMPLGALT
jgi:hypothetical protein